ncbi:hypothetical protein [Nocardia farcinica]|uniref:hypothetical protein n=1 Tax=Nocardia farcinica TaxID=37329 RepID=UPI001893262C|nr:hypothetical protein [Nocardia farcinica]MBF6250168.1 hypothetical protein [Nocardia farcinica]MBF6445510.1 hypothetical protein [Nocardia farcinica]MBF6523323.1 hypothetical protein [Nocardia farcinica]
MDDHVRDFLADHNIHDEPPTWHPPTELFDDLRLPGANPAEADIDRLHQLIRVEDRTIRETAETLGTTRDILRRHLLERNPAPLGAQSTAYQSTAYLKAKAALAPDTLADLYLRERLSIAEIAVRIDVDATALTHLARDYQIPSRKPGRPATTNIDRDWLHQHYTVQGRTLTELAEEAGVTWATPDRWAHRYNIPLRRLDSYINRKPPAPQKKSM